MHHHYRRTLRSIMSLCAGTLQNQVREPRKYNSDMHAGEMERHLSRYATLQVAVNVYPVFRSAALCWKLDSQLGISGRTKKSTSALCNYFELHQAFFVKRVEHCAFLINSSLQIIPSSSSTSSALISFRPHNYYKDAPFIFERMRPAPWPWCSSTETWRAKQPGG